MVEMLCSIQLISRAHKMLRAPTIIMLICARGLVSRRDAEKKNCAGFDCERASGHSGARERSSFSLSDAHTQ